MMPNPADVQISETVSSRTGKPRLTDGDEGRKVITEVVGVHEVREDDRQEVEPDEDVRDTREPEVGLLEEETEVSVATHEEIGRDEDPDRVVDPANLARANIVIDQDRDLHPPLPFVRLVTVEEPEILLDRFHRDDPRDERDDTESAKGESVVLLVLLEKEVRAVGDEEERDGETENGEREKVFLLGEEVV